MSLKVKTQKKGDTLVLSAIGDLSGADVSKIQRKFEETLDGHSGPIALDLSETNFIDSHGLGLLIFEWKQLKSQNRELILVAPTPFMQEILTNANMHKIVRVVGSIEDL